LTLAGGTVAGLHAAEPESVDLGILLGDADEKEDGTEESNAERLKRSTHFNLPSFSKVLRALAA
jgi:hypothetical protein